MKKIQIAASRAHRIFTLTAAVGLIGAAAAQAQLINDTFTTAVRVGSPTPAPGTVTGVDRDGVTPLTNDYVVATSNDIPMATGVNSSNVGTPAGTGTTGNAFFVTNTAVAYSVSTYFAPTTLNIGDTLSLSFDIRTTGNVTNGTGFFRLGLFNSGGTKQTANTNDFSAGGVFANDTGYIAQYDQAGGSVSGGLQERNGGAAGANLFAGTLTPFGSSAGTGTQPLANTTFPVTFTLTRTVTGVNVSSTFDGVTLTGTDTTTPFTTFDSVGIFFSPSFGNSTTARQNFVDNVVVTIVPEPTTAGLLFAAGAGLLCLRRKARR